MFPPLALLPSRTRRRHWLPAFQGMVEVGWYLARVRLTWTPLYAGWLRQTSRWL